MKDKQLFLLLTFILTACSPRIISDPVDRARIVGYDDKVLVIQIDETGPQDSVEYIGEINAEKGESPLNAREYNSFLNRVVYKARLMGGNVVKIISHESFRAKVYYAEDLSAVSYSHESANIYLLRADTFDKAFSFDVYLNGEKQWRSVAGNYSVVKLKDPGITTLMADKVDTTMWFLDVEKGKDYYIMTDAFWDGRETHYSFKQLDNETGERELDKLMPAQDPEHLHSGFELSFQVGPGARIGNVSNSPSSPLRSYLGRSRIGYSYDVAISYFFNDKYGCGLKYVDYSTTKVRVNNKTDVITLKFAGPLLSWRSKKAYDKNQYSVSFGMGAIFYSDDWSDGLNPGPLKATRFGCIIDGGYYRWLTTQFAVGAFIHTAGGMPIKVFEYDDSEQPSFAVANGPESVFFINAGIGAKVTF